MSCQRVRLRVALCRRCVEEELVLVPYVLDAAWSAVLAPATDAGWGLEPPVAGRARNARVESM